MRNGQQDADGVVGEVIFPNTVPPFFPGFVLFAPPPKPEDYEHRLAGIRAHNRWLEDFCGQFPERRAGIGQIFVNDLDDAIEDVKWIKEHNLRGGMLLPTVPPDATWLKPYNHPDYDRLWAVCEDLDVPVNCHGGIGGPEYIRAPVVGAHPDRRARPLLAPPADLHPAVGCVRALPEAEVRADRDGLRVDPGVPPAARPHARAGPQGGARWVSCASSPTRSCRSRRPSTSSRTCGSA